MATLVKHATLGRLAAEHDQDGNLHGYFVPAAYQVGWLWTDTTGIMHDQAANDP